jgi:hypothetical protein
MTAGSNAKGHARTFQRQVAQEFLGGPDASRVGQACSWLGFQENASPCGDLFGMTGVNEHNSGYLVRMQSGKVQVKNPADRMPRQDVRRVMPAFASARCRSETISSLDRGPAGAIVETDLRCGCDP